MTRITVVALIITAVSACRPKELRSIEDLNAFVNDRDNGLVQGVHTNGHDVQVVYRPTDFWVARQVKSGRFDKGELKAAIDKYDRYHYFVLNISNDSNEALSTVDADEFGDLVTTMSFRMSEFVALTTSSNDTIPVSDFVFDRTYGRSDANSLLFVFEKEKSMDDEWVQLNLNEFGMHTGNQHFRFRTKDLTEIPRLSFAEQKN